MKSFSNYIEKLFKKISTNPFLKGNNFQANTLLFLGVITFIIICIDLNSEIAVERDEIAHIIATLSKTFNYTVSNTSSVINPDLNCLGFVPITILFFHNSYYKTLSHQRAPPCKLS